MNLRLMIKNLRLLKLFSRRWVSRVICVRQKKFKMTIHTIFLCLVFVYAFVSLLVFGLLMGACVIAKRPMPGPDTRAVDLNLTKFDIYDHRVMPLVNPARIAA